MLSFVVVPPLSLDFRPAVSSSDPFCMDNALHGGARNTNGNGIEPERHPASSSLEISGSAVVRAQDRRYKDRKTGHSMNKSSQSSYENQVTDTNGVGKLANGTFGPTGIYGGWIKRSKLLDIFRQTLKLSRLKRIEQVLKQRCGRVQCVFENLHNSSNGSACIRTIENFGLQYLHAIESYDPFYIHDGISMSADKWLTVTRYKACSQATQTLKRNGFTLIATCLDEDSVPINEIDFSSMKKIAILFGNEERGLSLALTKQADIKCHLPSLGFTQSYNLSVSCAITLYHLYQIGVITPDLTSEEATYFYKQWVVRSTKKARFLIDKHGLHDDCDDF